MADSNCTYQFVDLLDISIRFGPSGALVSKKVCVTASLGADSFEKASIFKSNHVLEDCHVFLLHSLQLINQAWFDAQALDAIPINAFSQVRIFGCHVPYF